MILHSWYVNDLGYGVGDNAGHVGTGFPLPEEIGLAINIGVVASGIDKSVLDTHYANARWKQRLIAAYVNLVCITVIHDDVARRNSGRMQPGDDLAHNLRRGAAGRGSRGIDFDSNHVGRFNKPG